MNLQTRFWQLTHAERAMKPHLPRLYAFVVSLDAQQVIELGVRGGDSTVAFLAALERTRGRLWSCDVNPPRGHAKAVSGTHFWTFALGNDRDVIDYAPEQCDILFIDTSHEYEDTAWELEHYGARVRDGGVILLHDTDLDGVQRAVDEYLAKHGWNYKEYVRPDGPGNLGVIQKEHNQ